MTVTRITDTDGVVWEVEEVSRLQDPSGGGTAPAAHPSWLAFRSDGTIRLVHPYPRDWESLSADELLLLLRVATLHSPGT